MTSPFLISEPPIQVLPALAGAVGFDEAAALQEIHYWLDPRVNENFFEDRYWVSNVVDKLQERFFFWYEDSIDYMIAQFEQSGILIVSDKIFQSISQVSIKNSGKTKYHTINYELLKWNDQATLTPDRFSKK